MAGWCGFEIFFAFLLTLLTVRFVFSSFNIEVKVQKDLICRKTQKARVHYVDTDIRRVEAVSCRTEPYTNKY